MFLDALAMLLELHIILLASLIQEIKERYVPDILTILHRLSWYLKENGGSKKICPREI